MNLKSLNYPALISLLISVCCFLFAVIESERVLPHLQYAYIALKIFYGIITLLTAIYLIKIGPTDTALTFLTVTSAIYSLTFMWFVPLYEVAYFQCAIACSFFHLRKSWVFPTVFGAGLIGILAIYQIQENILWTLPPVLSTDMPTIVIQFFIIAWFIQKYAIGSFNREKEQLLRYSLIGKETTRLTHDIKGLLSSPLIIIESLRSNKNSHNIEEQIHYLAEDMSHVRDTIKSINSLVKIENKKSITDIRDVLIDVLKVVNRRISKVDVTLPQSKLVRADISRLHSTFFNLILNSIESIELKKAPNPKIHMWWENDTLVISDNVISHKNESKDKPHGTGIGLELVGLDTTHMNTPFTIHISDTGTRVEIDFKKVIP